MKNTFLLIVTSSILFSACQEGKRTFIEEVVATNQEASSVHYIFTQKTYYANSQDTTITDCEAWIVRDTTDAIRKGYVWVDNKYRPYHMMYDQGNFYLTIPPKKVTVLYPNYSKGFISEMDWVSTFLEPNALTRESQDPYNMVNMTDTIFDSKPSKKLTIRYPINNNKESVVKTYIFDVDQKMPVWAMSVTEGETSTYYDQMYFSTFDFDNVNKSELEERKKKIIATNPVNESSSNSTMSVLESMLHVGDTAPLFEGKFYTNDSAFAISDYIGKHVIILDFWYTHCPPCVRAIPALKQLYSEKEGAGLKIFGTNSVDNREESLAYLDKFLAKRSVNYDIIMMQSEVDRRYKIKVYPTMYIIDLEGKIALIETGFNDEKFEVIKAKVDELLSAK